LEVESSQVGHEQMGKVDLQMTPMSELTDLTENPEQQHHDMLHIDEVE
jgi:hypothetical protein